MLIRFIVSLNILLFCSLAYSSEIQVNIEDKDDLVYIYFSNLTKKNVTVQKNLTFNECRWGIGFCIMTVTNGDLNYTQSGGGSNNSISIQPSNIYGYILKKEYLPLKKIVDNNDVEEFKLKFFLPDDNGAVTLECNIAPSNNWYELTCK